MSKSFDEMLASVPPEHEDALRWLTEWLSHGTSYAEIAARDGISTNALEARLRSMRLWFRAQLFDRQHPTREGIRALLSRREYAVLELVARDLSNEQIAERLNLSRRTVEFHVQGIFGKLGVRTRLSAALLYHEIPLPEDDDISREITGDSCV